MSIGPADIAGASLQAQAQARDVAQVRDSAKAAERQAGEREAHAIDEAGDTVETTDDDTRVFTDGQGAGGQGREFSDEQPEGEDQTGAVTYDNEGRHQDADDTPRLDIQA